MDRRRFLRGIGSGVFLPSVAARAQPATKIRQVGVLLFPPLDTPFLGAVGVLLSISAAAQGLIVPDQPASVARSLMEPTMMRVVPYTDEMYTLSGVTPAVPYASCYRVGRCSAYDLYRFRDRPNRLTRLAPEAPPESVARPPSIHYLWFLVPVTPEETILPKYRTASQVRDEYRGVGRPIDDPN